MQFIPVKTKKCLTCGTERIDDFTTKGFDICRQCKRIKKNKTYMCKICFTTDREKFSEGRYSSCISCRTKPDINNIKSSIHQAILAGKVNISSLVEPEKNITPSNKVSTPETSIKSMKDFVDTENIEKYLTTNKNLFNVTIKEILENFSEYNIHKTEEDNERDDLIDDLNQKYKLLKLEKEKLEENVEILEDKVKSLSKDIMNLSREMTKIISSNKIVKLA